MAYNEKWLRKTIDEEKCERRKSGVEFISYYLFSLILHL